MPEGPEIRRAADKLADVLVGREIFNARFGIPRLRRKAKPLVGQRVIDIETRGKALLTHFDRGHSIYSHNQLYGVWRVVTGHKLPKTKRSLRILLQTERHIAILYSASDISLWPTEELPQHPFLARIGPDIMNSDLTWRQISDRLTDKRFSRRDLETDVIKGALTTIGIADIADGQSCHLMVISSRCVSPVLPGTFR